jgi:uncharacterized protein (TIGR04222 family)
METWGITGPRFLAVYAILLALSALAAWIDRRRRLGLDARTMDVTLDPYEIAVLNGGRRLAAAAAAANLREAGALRLEGRRLVLAGPLPAGAHRVERALYLTVARGDRRDPLLDVIPGNIDGIDEVEDRLVQLGLRWDRHRARTTLAVLLWFVPVLGLGLARLAAGLSAGRPVGFLIGLLVLTALLAAALARPPSGRTLAGDRVLASMRQAGPQPAWTSGAMPIGLAAGSVALFGAASLWEADAELASALGIARNTSAGLAGGGVYADGGGSSCSGGSSCGGGGGCGGGCGG